MFLEKKLSIGDRIRRLRERNTLQLRELARLANCSPSYLSELEHNKNKPSRAFLGQLAPVLNTSVDYLLTGEHPRKSRYQEVQLVLYRHGSHADVESLRDLMNRVFIYEIQRRDLLIDKKAKLVERHGTALKDGSAPEDIQKEFEIVDRTIDEVNKTIIELRAAIYNDLP